MSTKTRTLRGARATAGPKFYVFRSPATKVQEDAADRVRRPRSDDEEEAIDAYLSTKLEDGDLDATKRATLEALLKRHESGSEDNPPLSIVFDRWRAERKPPAKTWQEWDGARRRFEETVGGDLPVRAITKAHVRAFKDALLGSPSKRTGRPTSPATTRKLLGALASVLSWAVRQGYLDLSPTQGVTQVAAKNDPEARRLPYDEGDLARIIRER